MTARLLQGIGAAIIVFVISASRNRDRGAFPHGQGPNAEGRSDASRSGTDSRSVRPEIAQRPLASAGDDDAKLGRGSADVTNAATATAGQSAPFPSSTREVYRREIARYGTRVVPFERTSGVGWNLEFGHSRSHTRGSSTVLTDQSRTTVPQGDAVQLRMSIGPAREARLTLGELRRASTNLLVSDQVSFERSPGEAGDFQTQIETKTLSLGEYRVDVRISDDASADPITYFFEVVRQSSLNNRGIVGSSVESGHFVVFVAVDAPRAANVRAIARLTRLDGTPVAILRGESIVAHGTSRVPIVIPGAFVLDYLRDDAYYVENIELIEFASGADALSARPWRQRYLLEIPRDATWSEGQPEPPRTAHAPATRVEAL